MPDNYSAFRGRGWRGNKCLTAFYVRTSVSKSHAETHVDNVKSGMLFVVLKGKKCFPLSFFRFLGYLWYNIFSTLVREKKNIVVPLLAEHCSYCQTAIAIFCIPQAVVCSSNSIHVEEKKTLTLHFVVIIP